MFRFAGSDHSKYTTYLLEMISILELESSDILRDVFLKNWLVNPSGEPGRTLEGDLFEEHINHVLEDGISRKGAEWDSPYIREVHAPNAVHFLDLKNEWGTGVGLAKRQGRHTVPHSRPEILTLLQTYRATQLHQFRAGREYNSPPTRNLMSEGVRKLGDSKLQTFITESMRARGLFTHQSTGNPSDTPNGVQESPTHPTSEDSDLEARGRRLLEESDLDSSDAGSWAESQGRDHETDEDGEGEDDAPEDDGAPADTEEYAKVVDRPRPMYWENGEMTWETEEHYDSVEMGADDEYNSDEDPLEDHVSEF